MGINTKIEFLGKTFKNPVTTASGTFGSGKEFTNSIDLSELGGVIVKGVAAKAWNGNPPPRIAEVYGGMLNAVGLQNPGAKYFIEKDIPFLRKYDTNIIVNIAGHSIEEYVDAAKMLDKSDIDMLELNISCPNVKEGGVAFGIDPVMAEKVTKEVKRQTNKPLIVKLSPNVTDITEIAKAVEAGGADAVSLINTLIGMKIDIYRRKPVLAMGTGGFSGPAIKPVAVRMVNQVSKAVDIPIIGLGGIMTGEDVIEFMMAGASLISVGTANLLNPCATVNIINEVKEFMQKNNINDINEIIGIV